MRTDGSDGGPVFPCEGGDMSGPHADTGLSKLEWFAGMAMQGLLASGRDCNYKVLADQAYLTAYAMIERGAL